jgi:hypothetical protein
VLCLLCGVVLCCAGCGRWLWRQLYCSIVLSMLVVLGRELCVYRHCICMARFYQDSHAQPSTHHPSHHPSHTHTSLTHHTQPPPPSVPPIPPISSAGIPPISGQRLCMAQWIPRRRKQRPIHPVTTLVYYICAELALAEKAWVVGVISLFFCPTFAAAPLVF